MRRWTIVEKVKGISQKHRSALEEIVQHCPVHRSLDPNIETPVEFLYAD